MRGALKRRKELLNDANRLKKEVEAKVQDFGSKIEAFEVKVKDAEDNLGEVERREKMKAVRRSATGKSGGKLGVLSTMAKSRVDELRASLAKTKNQRDAMLGRVVELQDLLSALQKDYNPNFNDEGVKAAVRGWEDYFARDTDDNWSEAEDRDLEAVLKEDNEENGINWTEFEIDDEPESDVAVLYQLSAYLPPSLKIWLDEKMSSVRQMLVENGLLASKSDAFSAVAESKAVQDARKALSDAQLDLNNARNDLKHHQEDLDKDYGPEGIFRALKDQCVEKDSGEYVYELCFLSQTKQKSKKGGADTVMGNFNGYDFEEADEEVGPDGKGLGRGRRIVMKYENGQHCWNGPSRSTRVILACSEKEEIWKVSESEKCVYRMEVGTAAVCEQRIAGKKEEKGKDEL